MPAGIKLSTSQIRALLERVLLREGKVATQTLGKDAAQSVGPEALTSLAEGGMPTVETTMAQLYKNRAGQGLPPQPMSLPFDKAKEMYLNSEPGTFSRNFGRVPEALRLRPNEGASTGDPMQDLILERLKYKPVLTPAEQMRLSLVMREGGGLPQDPGAVQGMLQSAPQLTPIPSTRNILPMPEGMAAPTAAQVAQQAVPSQGSQALDLGNQLAEMWRKAGGGRGTFGKLWSGYYNAAKSGSGGAAVAERYKSPYEYYLGSGAQWKKSPGQFASKRPTEASRLSQGWKEYMGGE